MSNGAQVALLLIASYAAGCVVGAYYLVRWRVDRDLRELGSGNAGARNAGRVLGPAGFALALLLDAGKGAIVTWAALRTSDEPWVVGAALVAVVAGHVWPVQLRFRGGKGAATALGIMLVYDPIAAVILLAIGALALTAIRRFTLSGLIAIGLAPIVAAFRGHPTVEIAALVTMALLILYAHRANLGAGRSAAGGLSTGNHQEALQ
jgi:glycerol-3-phosphate acyltransferase PlsY